MKKTLFFFFVLIAPLFCVNSVMPDVSEVNDLQEAFEMLNSQPVTCLDLKMEQANRLADRLRIAACEDSVFPVLSNRCFETTFSYGAGKKLICHIDISERVFGDCLCTHDSTASEIFLLNHLYGAVKAFAKKHIHHSVDDENLLVVISANYKWLIRSDGYLLTQTDQGVIARWEDGQPTYYERFFKD